MRTAAASEVVCDVVYVTSVEMAQGGAARRERVVLEVVWGKDDRWRIAGYSEQR